MIARSRLLALAVAAGTAGGGGVAAIQASGDSSPSQRAMVTIAPPERLGPVDDERLRDGRYDSGFVHHRIARGTVRISARAPDPAGGPDWAVRTFDADRLALPQPARTLRGANVVGRTRCAEVGRIRNRRFGWIYADGTFTAYGPAVEGGLLTCGSRKRPETDVRVETVMRFGSADLKLTNIVVWGVAPETQVVAIRGGGPGIDGRTRTGGGGAMLRVGADPGQAPRVVARLTEDGRARERVLGAGASARGGFDVRGEAIVGGSSRIVARTPDPAGGPGHGVLVGKTADGGSCVLGTGQVIQNRLGEPDLRLGLFSETRVLSRCSQPRDADPASKRACRVATGFAGDHVEGASGVVRRARVERRLQPGRFTVTAECHPSVARVTLRTPRDVRTLVPSNIGHVIYAVYDGDFPAGDLVLTARRRDGTTWRETLSIGF